MNIEEQLDNSVSTRVAKARKSILAIIPYGSRLYGTNTPTSDYDYKTIYLPELDQVLLGEKFTNFKARFDANGNPIGDNAVMPENGFETEFIAVQTYMRDFLDGQTYAVELAFAIKRNLTVQITDEFKALNDELVEKFLSYNVSSMVGFAMKQTFDYVHRGQRLNEAKFFLSCINGSLSALGNPDPRKTRLDTPFQIYEDPNDQGTIYDFITNCIERSDFKDAILVTTTHNVNKSQRSFTFSGRQYLETMPLSELITLLHKRIDQYGDRTNNASENAVDPKSLMHAIRVYEQVIELLEQGTITFPRINAKELLAYKNLEYSAEQIRDRLIKLDAIVAELVKDNPPKTNILRAEFRVWVLTQLKELYKLNLSHSETFGHLKDVELSFKEAKDYLSTVANNAEVLIKDMYKSPEVTVRLAELRDLKNKLAINAHDFINKFKNR